VSLLEVTDLRVTLQTARGPADALRGVSFRWRAADTWADRRIGLRQVDHRAGADGPAARRRAGRGSIRFDGQELTTLPEARAVPLRGDRIGMVFQEPMTALNPLHTVGRQIAEPLRLHKGLSGAPHAPRRCACWSACSCRRPRSGWTPTRTSCRAASASAW
jgi:peptide/nickel transport system ATP-binding protein